MSNFKTNLAKNYNPMHSSLLFGNNQNITLPKEDDKHSQLSPFCTKATTSEVGDADHQEYMNITKTYQNRIKHLQSGFQRSKAQFQNSLKDLYKQKIVLLNIISHNQTLIDEFRNKLKLSNESTFKEIETKYSIIKSGLFHSQLCPDCILNISKTNFQQGKTPDKQKESVRNPESTIKKSHLKKSKIVLQYNWMYLPQEESMAVTRLKVENMKLKATLEEFMKENSRKLYECNRQIDFLRNQTNKASVAPVKMIPAEGDNQKIIRYKEKIKQLEEKIIESTTQREKSEKLAKELNQRIIGCQLEKINMKYKNKYF